MTEPFSVQFALEKAKEIAVATGLMQKENLGRSDLQIDTKTTEIDLVTEIDKKSETKILSYLKSYFPTHAFLSEETGLDDHQSDYLWIIDPLDGTTNYAQGLPIFAVSIALQYKKKTILGVVYTPMTEQLFWAIRGGGAYLNGERISVAAKTYVGDCVLATGFPYDIAVHPDNNINYFSRLIVKARAVRRMGAAAYDLACVAAGKFDGYWEMSLSPWDVAAAILMVEEAGGKVIFFREDRGLSLIAGNEAICGYIYSEIKQIDSNCQRQ